MYLVLIYFEITSSFPLCSTHLADDVGDGISSFDPVTPLRVDPQSDVHVREALLIRVVLRVFSQSLEGKHDGYTTGETE